MSGDAASMARDDLLDEVVVAYLEAAERGQAPSPQEWLSRYPELAPELSAFLADQDKVRRWTSPLRAAAGPAALRQDGPSLTADDPPVPPMPTRLGRLGDYELLEEIARGGMGIVYKARQVSLDRLVAVKMILAGQFASRSDVERFQTEAMAAGNLDHPNIVPVYEVGEHDGRHFFSMKLMEGGSLGDLGRQWRFRPRDAAILIAKVARAVHHAHQRGILHRDLKPGNVLLDRAGEPHVSDFGLAKRMEDTSRSGAVVGTPSYTAPEQACGQDGLTTAADVYSLGAMLYALLAGAPPFRGKNRLETLQLVAEQAPAPLRALNPLVDHDLETICLKCLDKSPSQRYPSAEALADDLHRFLAGEPIQARRVSVWVRGRKWARRNPTGAALLGVSLVAVLSLFLGALQYQEGRARAAVAALEEGRRTSSARAEARGLLLKGEEALARGEWSQARAHLLGARRLVGLTPALADLGPAVERSLVDTDRGLQQESARHRAIGQYRKFLELREQARFHGTLFTSAGLPADSNQVRATATDALRSFGVAVDVRGELGAGPIFDGPFTPAERKEVRESCYELLLILAETMAQDQPPRPKDALRALERAKKLGQQTKAYHLRRARYLQRLGDEEGARKESSLAAARRPAGAIDFYLMGEDWHRQGNLLEAIRAFQSALRLRPDHFWARYFLAVCYLKLQPSQPGPASDCLTACLAGGRDVLWVYLLRGVSSQQLGLLQAAEEDFQKALGAKPNDDARYAILINRGALFSRQRKFARATADLEQAIALRPKQYQAYANLAKVYQQQQQPGRAIDQLGLAIENAELLFQDKQMERPALALLYRSRGRLRLGLPNRQAALEDFQQAIRVSPCAEDHAECGRLLSGLRRYQEALLAYDAALKADRGHAGAYIGRAETLSKLGAYSEAVRSLDGYLKTNVAARPNVLADVYRARGLIGAKLGQQARAIADFTLALRLVEDSATRAYRGWAHLVNKVPQLALSDFEKAIQLDENNGNAYSGRGLVRVRLAVSLRQYQEGIADAEKGLRCGPAKDVHLLYNAARVHAHAAAKLSTERTARGLEVRSQSRERAIQLLREAFDLLPVAERRSFWRRYVQADPDLAPFAAVLPNPT
jgi:tetratricopeptide (TPR) repeat protein